MTNPFRKNIPATTGIDDFAPLKSYGERFYGRFMPMPDSDVDVAELRQPIVTVEEVHHDFETASEVLLESAQEQLAAINLSNGKASRLQQLGFDKVEEVFLYNNELMRKTALESQISTLTFYAIKYPQFKFITEAKALEISRKYNLVLGAVKDFKGFVPEVKLVEIENFMNHIPIAQTDMRPKQWDGRMSTAMLWDSRSGRVTDVDPFKNNDPYDKSLSIIAPIKDFDMTGKEVRGYKVVDRPTPPDPIVLFPVREGYLIISKWGEEASDPDVMNENHN